MTDADMQARIERDHDDLERLKRLRSHCDQPFIVELLETYRRRCVRLHRPKHAAFVEEVIALLSQEDV